MPQQEHSTLHEIPVGWKKDLSLKHIFTKPAPSRDTSAPRPPGAVPFIKTKE